MTDAERLEEIGKRHRMEVAEGNCAGSYSWDPEGWYRPQGHDLDLAVEDIGVLLVEVERLRAIIAWAGNEEAVRIAGLPNPSLGEPSHAH